MPEKSQRNLPVRVEAISAGLRESVREGGSEGETSELIGLRPRV